MSMLISAATGSFTSASTWKVADTAVFLDSLASSTATTVSYVASAAATPGAITIDGMGVNFASRIASPVGTFSCELYNSTDAASVKIVTVNVSDISAEGGWHIFAFSSVTLIAGKNYSIRIKTSVTGEATVLRDATAGNWSRVLRTTSTAAPAAGDNLMFAGELTGAGASTSYTVTNDNTAGTIFGTVSATVPSVTVNRYASFICGTAASTNYRFKVAGMAWVNGGGTVTVGTVATPIPATSTAAYGFSIATNVDGGWECHNTGAFQSCGVQLRTVNRCFLNAAAAVADTVLTTDVAMGAKAGDQIIIATTTRTITQSESFILGVDTVGTTLTLPSGLAYPHSGAAGRQAEIINVTRNVKIQGTSTALCAYVHAKAGALVDCRQTEFTMLGSTTAGKRGVGAETTSNLANFVDCSFHDFNQTLNSTGLHVLTAGAGLIATRCDFWNTFYMSVYLQAGPAATGTLVDDCWVAGGAQYGVYYGAAGASVTNCRIAGVVNPFPASLTTAGVMGTVSGNVIHSSTSGPVLSNIYNSSATGWTVWRTGGQGFSMTNCINLSVEITESVGNVSSSFTLTGNKRCLIKILSAKGETGYTQPYSCYLAGPNLGTVIYDSVFGAAGAPGAATTGDIVTTAANADVIFHNTQFLSPTEFTISTWYYGIGYRSEKHNGIAGNNKYVRYEGTMTRDTTIYDTGGTVSLRVTPIQAATKVRTEPAWATSVLSGGTVTPSVRIRKSVVGDGTAYNGNQPRLMMRANPVAGFNNDVVIATCSGAAGSWETVTGTTGAVAENTRLEFYVDCDGTTGWINVDNFTVAADVTSDVEVWSNGTPYIIGSLSLANFTDIDPAKVEDAYAWKYNSSVNNRTGTRVQPTVGTVQIGVTYGPSSSLTGTYDGSDRWTDPDIANVRLGTAYKANSTTNNRTGNVTIPATGEVKIGVTYDTLLSLTGAYVAAERYTDPGIANVRNGTSYQFNSLTNNRTGDVTIPTTAQVQIGVTYDTLLSATGTYVAAERYSDPGVGTVETGTAYQFNSLTNNRTGTYTGANRWTDPGDANVRYGVAYKAGSLTNNMVGRQVSPLVTTVLDGIGYDTDGLMLGTMVAVPALTILQLGEIWTRLGLDAANPLDTNNTTGVITAGSITMSLTGTASHSTLTRQP